MLLKGTLFLLVVVSVAVGQSTHERGGTGRRHAHSPTRHKASRELTQLVTRLRRTGAAVVLTKERVSQPFFAIRARTVKIDDEAVQVFEYPRISAVEVDAKKISVDGNTIGTSKPSWMAPPHFFKRGKFLVLYLGSNQEVLNGLQKALGTQFAGA